MRTLRPCLAGTVSLTLVGALAIGVHAQEEDLSDRLPPDTAPSLEWESGTAECGVAATGPTKRGVDWSRLRGWTLECQLEMSDPRLTGELRGTFGQDCTDDGCLSWWTMSMGHGDAWSGWMVGTSSADGEEVSLVVLTGGVENEGYTAVLTGVGRHGEPGRTTGYIYEGDPPPPVR